MTFRRFTAYHPVLTSLVFIALVFGIAFAVYGIVCHPS